ncbi:MAG: acyl-CoA dehydrogenase family protein [Bacteroidota bacterium]|nr:acyl-CoA dehydrogenase family protein [Bacteroidota bacterium]
MDKFEHSTIDYFNISDLLTEEHLLIRKSVRQWTDTKVKNIIDEAAQTVTPPDNLNSDLGKLGAFGSFIPEEYGGAGMDYISYGLINYELERGDSSIRSTASVQSSLVMYPIYEFGSEQQKKRFLPKLASGEQIGAYGLTEPNHGSDPGSMETKLTKNGDSYLLNGAKMWITNSPICDMAVVWAKDEKSVIRGVIVERDFEGFTTPEINKKWSLRASHTGELVFDNVLIPKENILPNIQGIKGPLMCLNSARYGIAWGVLGAAEDCLQTAIKYSKERMQFSKPIAAFQLTQKKIAEMITDLTKAQLLAWRLGMMKNEGKASPAQISMAKRNNVETALNIARESRQILGAMGISGDFPIMRHMMNLESVITYEGTHDIHLLITGMDVLGISAFS